MNTTATNTTSKYDFTLKDLFEAGVHYGHSRARWNPKMGKYLYSVRNGTHIIDIQQTLPMLKEALSELEKNVANNGRILFVATKANAQKIVKEVAQECGQYYVNHRWLGGMLTNWKTVAQSIKRLDDMEKSLSKPEGLTKKELLKLERQYEKLERAIGGIRKMGGLPSALFVIDVVKEDIAVKEAIHLGIPIFGIVDSNADPSLITHPVPGNDDAIRSIKLYCELAKKAIISGLQKNIKAQGIDLSEDRDSAVDAEMKEVFQKAETQNNKEGE